MKIQYPGVAEAVDTDLRNATLLLPLVKRLAPGLDAKALATEMRERIGEELDYELEAQNQRRIEGCCEDILRPRAPCPHELLDPARAGARVRRGGALRGRAEGRRGAARPLRRDRLPALLRVAVSRPDRPRKPHPGNYLLCPDGRVYFLDFGRLRDVDASRVAAERAIALAVRDGDAEALKAALRAGGYLPASHAYAVDAAFALGVMRMAIKWYAVEGECRFSPADARRARDRERPDREERAAMRMQPNQFALPPEAILIRRMHGIVAVVFVNSAPAPTGARSRGVPAPRAALDGAGGGRSRLLRPPRTDDGPRLGAAD